MTYTQPDSPRVGRFVLGLCVGLILPLTLALRDRSDGVPPAATLPGIFSPGARILSPSGAELTVKEVAGDWVRVEGIWSSETVSWIYLPTGIEWRSKR